MRILNQSLERAIAEADGRYLDTQELMPLEYYIQSYSARQETYQHLRENSDKLVLYALRKLAQEHPELIQQHGARCKYDMTEVLRYIALSILKDDEVFFREAMMSWLDTVLVAHKRTNNCITAYRALQGAITTAFPASTANLSRPYFEIVLQSLQSHA
jgi:hypothetical protein